jgi:environmental stress-induced protein Ves
MKIEVLAPEKYVKQSWRNGGGTAHEIARAPREGTAFDTRVSIADIVVSGPFSTYAGYDRWLLMIDGHVSLSLGGRGQSIDLVAPDAAPMRFDGATAIDCELRSPNARALNVIARRGKLNTTLVVADNRRLAGPGQWVVVALRGAAKVSGADVPEGGEAELHEVVPLSAARIEIAEGEAATVDASAACVALVRF